MSFHEIRFPSDLSFGSSGGPERLTEIVTLANGFEERNTPWADSRRRYDAGLGMRSLADVDDLIAFFEARRGQLHAFRWKDWADYRSSPAAQPISHDDQGLGAGDGVETVFQLSKRYVSGSEGYTRAIRKPVAGTVLVGVGGSPVSEGTDYTLDTTTGELTFLAAPAPGVAVTAGFEFDVPVRFDTDSIRISAAGFNAGDVPSIPVVEVRI